MFTKKSGNQRL